ncbi:hypothetical protein LO739_23415 (plasmid) [Leclercia adecarboxylata]|uniref:Uncharacterized protein n=1 Tax=Leclercia adecarboxylata TaxID=83655 RepID=A0A482LYU4_9ENTR|nr:hypothetical protein [Leclercia adecarboxylata]QBQ66485.1 Hypothetical protein [Leclercia adecarboxylata]UFM72041.1 hypothetical protein LO739_23415 [Leclercia adecarboxylata]
MFSLFKDLLSIPVISTIILAVLAAIFRKYISFSRRDFFSRPPLEQVEAIKWLRKSIIPSSDPLALAEQQFRLQSFGLHRDWKLSFRLISFYSSHSQTYLPSLKTVLRWPGLYAVDDGKIYLHKQAKWFLPIMLAYILTIMGSEILKNYSHEYISRFYLSLTVTVAALIVWGWMVSCTLKIYRLSNKLNAHTLPQSDADERNP